MRTPSKARPPRQGDGARNEQDDYTPMFSRRQVRALIRLATIRAQRGRMLTVSETARMMNIDDGWVRDLILDGSIPTKRLPCGCRAVCASSLANAVLRHWGVAR